MSMFRSLLMANAKQYDPIETVVAVEITADTLEFSAKLINAWTPFIFSWGDGTETEYPASGSVTSYAVSHAYSTPGAYTIRAYQTKQTELATPIFQRSLAVVEVQQLGNKLYSGAQMFHACRNLRRMNGKLGVVQNSNLWQMFAYCGANVSGGTVFNDAFTPTVSGLLEMFYGARIANLPTKFKIVPDTTSFKSLVNAATVYSGDISNIFPEEWATRTGSINCANAFKGQSRLTGTAPAHLLWEAPNITWSDTTGCFSGCTGLSNYHEIPASWGGGGA